MPTSTVTVPYGLMHKEDTSITSHGHRWAVLLFMVGIVQWDYGQVSPKFRGGENWGLSSSIMDGHAQLDLEALERDILINYLVIISPILVVFD